MRVIKESRPLARPKRFALVVACVLTCLAADEARAQVCGDGTVDGGESCDDGNTENGDSSTLCSAAAFMPFKTTTFGSTTVPDSIS